MAKTLYSSVNLKFVRVYVNGKQSKSVHVVVGLRKECVLPSFLLTSLILTIFLTINLEDKI